MSAVIFDLDGTLLDTLGDLTDSINHVLAAADFPVRTEDEVRLAVGNGLTQLVRRSVPAGTTEDKVQRLSREMSAWYADHCEEKTAPYPGVVDMLATLKERGVAVGVASNKPDAAVQRLLPQYFDGLVDAACGEREDIARKPAPDTVFEVLRRLGASGGTALDGDVRCAEGEAAGSVFYVGDSDTDIETAANAGLPCLCVGWGFRDRDFLLAHGATEIYDTPAELLTRLLPGASNAAEGPLHMVGTGR